MDERERVPRFAFMKPMEPFKTVKTEYYEELDSKSPRGRRIKVVTTTEEWMGSAKDPVTHTNFVYL
jgi:hypothetical protein